MPVICLSKSNGVKLRMAKDHFGCIPGKAPNISRLFEQNSFPSGVTVYCISSGKCIDDSHRGWSGLSNKGCSGFPIVQNNNGRLMLRDIINKLSRCKLDSYS